MTKYRKKPVVIDAFKWTGGPDQIEDPTWIVDKMKEGEVFVDKDGFGKIFLYINTLEGLMHANVGDYIIKGIEGEIYPCKPDIFDKTYDKIVPSAE